MLSVKKLSRKIHKFVKVQNINIHTRRSSPKTMEIRQVKFTVTIYITSGNCVYVFRCNKIEEYFNLLL